MTEVTTISDYLIHKLDHLGVKHVFGVPGDFALKFFNEIERSELQIINTTDAQGAGFAADAYARVTGISAICVTYGVGGFAIVNAVAQAFAEKSPVVIISGGPSRSEREKNLMYHHKVGDDFNTQKKVFENITVASTILDNPETAVQEIDRVIAAALQHKQPVYIELSSDLTTIECPVPPVLDKSQVSDCTESVKEAVKEAKKMINSSHKPVIIAGVEVQRFGLQEELNKFLAKTNIPFVTMLLGKSVVSETHPQYMGLYIGAFGKEDVMEYVESSDCLIMLGAFRSELNLGTFTASLDQSCTIDSLSDKTTIKYHTYKAVHLDCFLNELLRADIDRKPDFPRYTTPAKVFPPADKQVSIKYLQHRLGTYVDDNTVIIADPGNAIFIGAELTANCNQYLAPAYYLSMGFAIPAGIGVQFAKPELRPLVLVGDGAFLMTGIELATAARYKLSPVVIVLNNRGYSSERRIVDGCYNDVPLLKYSKIPDVLGSGEGYEIRTESDLDNALKEVREYTDRLCVLDVHLDPKDIAPILQGVADALEKRRKSKKNH